MILVFFKERDTAKLGAASCSEDQMQKEIIFHQS